MVCNYVVNGTISLTSQYYWGYEMSNLLERTMFPCLLAGGLPPDFPCLLVGGLPPDRQTEPVLNLFQVPEHEALLSLHYARASNPQTWLRMVRCWLGKSSGQSMPPVCTSDLNSSKKKRRKIVRQHS